MAAHYDASLHAARENSQTADYIGCLQSVSTILLCGNQADGPAAILGYMQAAASAVALRV